MFCGLISIIDHYQLLVEQPHPCSDFSMTPVGFEPTQLALVELESTPLDHSGKVSLQFPCPRGYILVFKECAFDLE